MNFLTSPAILVVNNAQRADCASSKMFSIRDDIVDKEHGLANQLKQHHFKIHNLNDLDVIQSTNFVSSKSPMASIKLRNKGTELWPKSELTPGPGYYDHKKFETVKRNMPRYSVPIAKHELNTNYNIGPFVTL